MPPDPGVPQAPLTLRVAQIVELLSVPRSTIYRWIELGVLPASRVQNVILVRSSDVEELLQRHSLPSRRKEQRV
jgi:excisionase family DNA binding protein